MTTLARYELLNLRRRRRLIASTALTIGAVSIAITVLAVLHADNSHSHAAAGGALNLSHQVFLLSMLGALAGVLVGATAGAGDITAGVFRDLVLTGRPALNCSSPVSPPPSPSCFHFFGSRSRWLRQPASR